MMGNSDASFFDLPSVLIVILGTMTATCVSFTTDELKKSLPVLGSVINRPVLQRRDFAKSLMDLAAIARKRGVLALARYDTETRKNPFLQKAVQMIVDGYGPEDVHRVLQHEIDAGYEHNRRAAGIFRRASEIAPAMGLIGTLVGLVQMLANLEDPEVIGPAMAVALLTTFYGVIIGPIILAPLATKVDKFAADEAALRSMILKTVISIVRQENPRNLEMLINSELPPSERIIYFD
jgi:chemotaxis protein MotA